MTKNEFLATTLCEIVEDMLVSSDITIKTNSSDANSGDFRLYGMKYDNLRKDFENRMNIEYIEGKNTDWGYARKLFILSHDNHNKSTQTKLQVYSDYSQANEAMLDYLEKHKDTSFWWDKENNRLNPNCKLGISSTHFVVYEKGKENENYELFSIEECMVDLSFRIGENAVVKLDSTLDSKSIQAYDIYLQEYYITQKNKLPYCYKEFLWKEWQDIDGRKYYENKMAKSTKEDGSEM